MFKTEIGKHKLEVQIGKLAIQASGSCFIKIGETSILVTSQKGEEKPNLNFFPLTCNYEERYYAVGKILGSRFIRRESRPSTEAVLISRLIDRIIRPSFPKNLKNEIQVIATCLSWDEENDPAILAVLGTSIALSISDIPWQGPAGAVRIGKVEKNFILNPNYLEREEGELDLVVSGTEKDGEILINMLELQGKEISEKIVSDACDFAQPYLKKLIDFQKEIIKKLGKEKITLSPSQTYPNLEKEVKKFLGENLIKALYQKDKQKRDKDLEILKQELLEKIEKKPSFIKATENEEKEKINQGLIDIFQKEKEKILRENILKKEKRPDGRKLDEIREIKTEVGFLPRTHGSGIFSRGKTKVLSILTLGSPKDQQLLEGMEISCKKRFLHHYNFPPYSSGEVRPIRGPGRREIGHGALAEKALLFLLPKFEDFPYTIRVVSEILSSNGSTSMASVSAASLALMDGGVPIARPAAGIAIGLVTEENGNHAKGTEISDKANYKLLTDIQGPEDSLGDMDFKVAGTEKGITVIQMDVKIEGISQKILKESLERAKKARSEILEIQNKTLSQPREQLSVFAPRVYIININPEKIGLVIGPGGRVINEISKVCGVSIDIEESGKIFVAAEEETGVKRAIDWIKSLTHEVKAGEIFQGKVKKIFDFGAVVEIIPGQEGLCHISQLADFRIERIQDFIKINDIIPVKIINVDENGKISLSAKQAGFKPKRR